MKINQQVTLKSFLWSKEPQKKIPKNENYWKLIGDKGKIIDEEGIEYLFSLKEIWMNICWRIITQLKTRCG